MWCLSFVLVAIGSIWWLATRTPDFYRQRLQPPDQGWRDCGFEFERRLLDLSNDARRIGRWRLQTTDDLVNGWLAMDLMEKFPGSLPDSIAEPRLAIFEDNMAIAFQVDAWIVRGVATVRMRPQIGTQPNELILEIQQTQLGWLPLPNRLWRHTVEDTLRSQGLIVLWIDSGPKPTLIVRFPQQMTVSENGYWELESIEVSGGSLLIEGQTRRPASGR